MSLSMQHCNGDQVCAIDCETTGLDSAWHEIWQIAIIPLDSTLMPRTDVLPLNMLIKPTYIERIDAEARKVGGSRLVEACVSGFDPEVAHDLLVEWINKLKLPYTKWGTPKRIIPLGHNYSFDKAFIEQWLGVDEYDRFFHYHYRDTMVAATYLNDKASFHGEQIPFMKVKLQWLATTLNIAVDRAHDALSDCHTTVQVYKRLIQKGLF